MENQLMNEYKKIKDTLKTRTEKGSKDLLSKEEYLNYIFERLDKKVFEDVLKEYTPKEYFIQEAMKNDPKLKDKFFDLLKDEK